MSYRNSYADGVPLYLNKKYYPIPRSRYKEVDCHIPLDALQEGYDFTLERQALVECEQYEKQKKEKAEEDEELRKRLEVKAKADAEAAAAKAAALVREYEEELAKQTNKGNRVVELPKHSNNTIVQEVIEVPDESPMQKSRHTPTYGDNNSSCSSSSMTPSSSSSGGAHQPESYNHHHHHHHQAEPVSTYNPQVIHQPDANKPPVTSCYSHHHVITSPESGKPSESLSYPQIIQPEPLMRPFDPTKYVAAVVTPRTPAAHSINLSDFESDTANPFDNVELKSINDMAVLATVLQNNVSCNLPRTFSGDPQQHPHQQQQQQQQQHPTRAMSNTNINSGNNGAIPQPIPYYPSYLSQNSNSYPNPHHHQWTPTSQNPFYSHFTPTMVTAATTIVGTSASSDSVVPHHQQQQQSPITTTLPMHSRQQAVPVTSQENSAPYSTSSVMSPNNQINPPPPHPSAENFANFYFPFTSSQAQSRLKNPDREFS